MSKRDDIKRVEQKISELVMDYTDADDPYQAENARIALANVARDYLAGYVELTWIQPPAEEVGDGEAQHG